MKIYIIILLLILDIFYSYNILPKIPLCKNCRHFIPNDNINNKHNSIGKCKLFLITDTPPTQKDYYNVEYLRNKTITNNNTYYLISNNICGKNGVFFKKI
jgi:hypothetical protein